MSWSAFLSLLILYKRTLTNFRLFLNLRNNLNTKANLNVTNSKCFEQSNSAVATLPWKKVDVMLCAGWLFSGCIAPRFKALSCQVSKLRVLLEGNKVHCRSEMIKKMRIITFVFVVLEHSTCHRNHCAECLAQGDRVNTIYWGWSDLWSPQYWES